MRHKPKAKAKRPKASPEVSKARAVGGATRTKAKTTAVKSRLKGAKTVVAAVKSKTVAKAASAMSAKPRVAKPIAKPVAKTSHKPSEKPVAATRTISRPVVTARSIPLKTRKPKTALSGAKQAKFALGQVVKHRIYAFRGVVFDIDPVFANTEDWWLAIPADVRPRKDQPFYHLLAENDETEYIAYVSEQNLIADTSGQPLRHPQLQELFVEDDDGRLRAVFMQPN